MTKIDNSEDKSAPCDPISEAEIDEALVETFPASDPSPWTLGVEPHCQPGEENKRKGDDPFLGNEDPTQSPNK